MQHHASFATSHLVYRVLSYINNALGFATNMAFLRSLYALSAVLLLAQARQLPGRRHEAFDIKQIRQADPVAISALATPTGVLTIITPSPGASPVQVTKQSQIVTSYVPEYTLCDLPPVGFFHISRPTTIPSTAPFKNYSMTIPPGNGSCTTIYRETATMVCATTLTDLTTTYPVTKCPQEITFSTQYGYVLATPTAHANSSGNWTNGNWTTGTYGSALSLITPAPRIRTLTTYFIAPWQQLTTAGPPEDVDLKVCAMLSNGTENCVREYQVWQTSLLTINATTTTSVNFTTTIPGPSQLIIATYSANLTRVMQTFSMSTTVEMQYVIESVNTTTFSRTESTTTGPTVYQTHTVEEAR